MYVGMHVCIYECTLYVRKYRGAPDYSTNNNNNTVLTIFAKFDRHLAFRTLGMKSYKVVVKSLMHTFSQLSQLCSNSATVCTLMMPVPSLCNRRVMPLAFLPHNDDDAWDMVVPWLR